MAIGGNKWNTTVGGWFEGLKVEYDPRNMLGPGAVGRKYMRMMNSFPPKLWNPIQDRIKKRMSQQVTEFRGATVSDSTIAWRKSMHNKSRSVETHTGKYSRVLPSTRVGSRTGTLLKDLDNSSEPGVSMWEGIPWGGKHGDFGQPIKNGSMNYTIHADAFSRSYPIAFQDYLINSGLLGSEGYLGFSNEQPFLGWALDYLNRNVKKHFVKTFEEDPWS